MNKLFKVIKYLLVALILFELFFLLRKSIFGTEQYSFSDSVFGIVNNYRASNGLRELKKDNFLCEFANKRAYEASKKWSHDGFYHNGYASAGENLARRFAEPGSVVSAWIESETHKFVLDGFYSVGCVGIYIDDKGDIYVALEVALK